MSVSLRKSRTGRDLQDREGFTGHRDVWKALPGASPEWFCCSSFPVYSQTWQSTDFVLSVPHQGRAELVDATVMKV